MKDVYGSLEFQTPEVLRQLRAGEAQKMAMIRRNQLSGVDYASAELGNVVGGLLRQGMARAGLIKDPEMERAEKAQSAINRAKQTSQGELRPSDPLEASIYERRELIAELQASGLHNEADHVRGQLLQLQQQQLEMQKLQGQIRSTDALADKRELESDYLRATAASRVREQQVNELKATLDYETAFVTAPYKIMEQQEKLEGMIADNAHNRQIRPFLQSKAQSDAGIRALEAQYGGTVPELTRLQARRDTLLMALAEDPTNELTRKNLTEIEEAIKTRTMNIQRNVDNYQPTTGVLGAIQSDALALEGVLAQTDSLLRQLHEGATEPFGATADVRRSIGGYLNQGFTLLGMGSLGNRINEQFFSENELRVRANSRQLHAEITDWISGNTRMTETDRQTAHDLIQVLDTPEVTAHAAIVALTEFSRWATEKQARSWRALDQGVRAVVPGIDQPGESAEEEDWLNSWLMGAGD